MLSGRTGQLIDLDLGDQRWRLMTDQVMGGQSTGRVGYDTRAGRTALVLSGHVSTRNNGGFIQVVFDIDQQLTGRIAECTGVRLAVIGNGHSYNVHLRTDELLLPWQSYRVQFTSSREWQIIELPFKQFSAYKTDKQLNLAKLKRIGVVAIGADFDADIAIGQIGFYCD